MRRCRVIVWQILVGYAVFLRQVQAYIDAGVTHVIIGMRPSYDRRGLPRFAKEVVPAFR